MASTTGELVKAKAILVADVEAAVAAYLADPEAGEASLGGGYVIDIGQAIAGSVYAMTAMGDPDASQAKRRTAVQTAILLAEPRAAT